MALINGKTLYDGTSIEVDIENIGTVTNIKSINYGMSVDRQKPRGTGQKTLGYTPGIINVDECSMEMGLAEFNNWLTKSETQAGGFLNSTFDVSVTYRDLNEQLIEIVLQDCKPRGWSAAHTFGTSDDLVVPVTFDAQDISWNSANLISISLNFVF